MTREEAQTIAKQAATEAVKQAFGKMGFDTDDPRESQADMVYLRGQRRASEKAGLAVKIAVYTTVITGGLAMVWIGIKHSMNGQ